eukprot:scaffold75904_cov58-Attheya_sp.AAC.2
MAAETANNKLIFLHFILVCVLDCQEGESDSTLECGRLPKCTNVLRVLPRGTFARMHLSCRRAVKLVVTGVAAADGGDGARRVRSDSTTTRRVGGGSL